jgi:hypothetical protein
LKIGLPLEPGEEINQVFSRLWPVATDNTKALVSSRGSRLLAGALKLANEDDSNEMKERELKRVRENANSGKLSAFSNSVALAMRWLALKAGLPKLGRKDNPQ